MISLSLWLYVCKVEAVTWSGCSGTLRNRNLAAVDFQYQKFKEKKTKNVLGGVLGQHIGKENWPKRSRDEGLKRQGVFSNGLGMVPYQ